MANQTRGEIRCFHFVCPECGLSDAEIGSLATAGEVHCIVCLNEDNQHVFLRRWHAEVSPDAGDPLPEQR